MPQHTQKSDLQLASIVAWICSCILLSTPSLWHLATTNPAPLGAHLSCYALSLTFAFSAACLHLVEIQPPPQTSKTCSAFATAATAVWTTSIASAILCVGLLTPLSPTQNHVYVIIGIISCFGFLALALLLDAHSFFIEDNLYKAPTLNYTPIERTTTPALQQNSSQRTAWSTSHLTATSAPATQTRLGASPYPFPASTASQLPIPSISVPTTTLCAPPIPKTPEFQRFLTTLLSNIPPPLETPPPPTPSSPAFTAGFP